MKKHSVSLVKGLIFIFAFLLALTPVGGFLFKTAFGYVSSTPPSNASIVINNDDATTSSTSVSLTLAATGATQMVLCNDSSFAACSWEAYATSKTWTLTSGDGAKNVYVMFRNATFDQTPILGDSITLATPGSTSGTAGGGGGATPAPAPTTTTTTTPTAAPETTTTTTPAAAPVAVLIQDPTKLDELLSGLSLVRNQSEEAKYMPLVRSDAIAFKVSLTEAQVTAITNFVTYGISSATVKLGAGERRALARDYFETVGRSDFIWSDIERMATGLKVVNRNLVKEQAQVGKVLTTFKTLVGHAPNFKDADEDLAWNTMMYRIRFTRDLAKERVGILKFKAAFGVNPTTPLGWSTVRAWGYILQ
jgi:hypothetical protein